MYTYEAKVIKVVDGDTIDALIDLGFDMHKSIRVRLVGINSPESRTRDLEEKKLGLAAKARTKELLESVSSKPGYFRIKSHGVGKYGRVLAEIYIQDKKGNSINVNKKLIHEGHAYIYDGGKKKVYTY